MTTRSKFVRSLSTEKEFDGEDVCNSGSNSFSTSYNWHGKLLDETPLVLSSKQSNHLLLVALLEFLCSQYGADDAQSEQLFKVLVKQLSRMNIMSPSSGIDELSTIRAQYKHSIGKLLHGAISMINTSQEISPPALKNQGQFHSTIPHLQHKLLAMNLADSVRIQTSRYRNEYTQMGLLGRGAYGFVYKAVNKLDGAEYAVKKVAFQESKPELWRNILREVKHLARLTHKHVIRYHNAWVEYGSSFFAMQGQHSSALGPTSGLPAITYEGDSHSAVHAVDDSGDSSIVFRDSDGIASSRDDALRGSYEGVLSNSRNFDSPRTVGIDWSKGRNTVHFNEAVEHTTYNSSGSLSSSPENADIKHSSCMVLHIQMELCQTTLTEWLRDRNNAYTCDKSIGICEEDSTRILKQILKGVEYIHSHGYIHRDLKPQNIFLMPDSQGDYNVKIGDFGLARHLSPHISGSPTSPMTPNPGRTGHALDSESDEVFTSGIGTTIYAAPEQLKGPLYNKMDTFALQADMYSVGLIIVELYQPFSTEMERRHTLSNVRKLQIPDDFQTRWPVQARYVDLLTSHNPYVRPTAKTVLDGEIFCTKDQVIASLKEEKKQDTDRISELEKQLRELKQEHRILVEQKQTAKFCIETVCKKCQMTEAFTL